MATALMSVKLDADEKALFAENAEALGMTPSSAIKVFIRQFNEYRGFPFEVRRPLRLNPNYKVPVAKMIDGKPVMPDSWLEDDDNADELL